MKNKMTIVFLILIAFFPLRYLHNYIERSKHRDENIHRVVAPIPIKPPIKISPTPLVEAPQTKVKPITVQEPVGKKVRVRGYVKKDGTRVESYIRDSPNKRDDQD